MTLPPWLVDLLDSCPATGGGVHQWIPRVAHYLHGFYDEETIFPVLKEKTRTCGRAVPDREIKSAIEFARANAYRPREEQLSEEQDNKRPKRKSDFSRPLLQKKWPEPDLELITGIVKAGPGLFDLWEQSPVRFEDEHSHTEEIIDVLFPGDPWLCCGFTSYNFATRRRQAWRKQLGRQAVIVPSPMLEKLGVTQSGKRSQHTLEQTARRIYLVVEFDFSEFARDGKTETSWAPLVREWRTHDIEIADACAALHLHLAVYLPLVCAVHSGGKSLHGWFTAHAVNGAAQLAFMKTAVELGADTVTWCPSQFVRMPGGTRENGKRQVTYYFNPPHAVRL